VGGGGGAAGLPRGEYIAQGGRGRGRANTIVVLAMLVPILGVVGSILVRLVRR